MYCAPSRTRLGVGCENPWLPCGALDVLLGKARMGPWGRSLFPSQRNIAVALESCIGKSCNLFSLRRLTQVIGVAYSRNAT